MSSQVLYRKWRPQIFSHIVGQNHVIDTLRQQVRLNRVAHAYMFSGPRGTGKTTAARILSKALNCCGQIDGEPDNTCRSCSNINSGRSLDIIEMDAASNRGIDEIRHIRDKVHFSPTESRFKVYIVDEAHMLTEAASNAFLKTLEEPPPHVIFVLCTTESHKILPTIVSRCQRFNFRKLVTNTIIERLQFLCGEEGIEPSPKVLEYLAKTSNGSLRDAENLLEQLTVAFGTNPSVQQVHNLLGIEHSKETNEIVSKMLMGHTADALSAVGRASYNGSDMRLIHKDVVNMLRNILMIWSGADEVLEIEKAELLNLKTMANSVSPTHLMNCIKAMSQTEIKTDEISALPLELAIITTTLESSIIDANLKNPSSNKNIEERPNHILESKISNPQEVNITPDTESLNVETFRSTENHITTEIWDNIVQVLRRHKGKRFFLGALLRDCKLPFFDNDRIMFPFSHRSNLERMETELDDITNKEAVDNAIKEFLGSSHPIELILQEDPSNSGQHASTTSPLVRAIRNMGGRILEERKFDE